MLPVVLSLVVIEHLGKLHRYEAAFVYLLAFGPFLLLVVTIRVARRRLREEDEDTPVRDPAVKPEDSTSD